MNLARITRIVNNNTRKKKLFKYRKINEEEQETKEEKNHPQGELQYSNANEASISRWNFFNSIQAEQQSKPDPAQIASIHIEN